VTRGQMHMMFAKWLHNRSTRKRKQSWQKLHKKSINVNKKSNSLSLFVPIWTYLR